MNLPSIMRYVEVENPGGPEVMRLVHGPLPQPGEGELLIRVMAAGVNRPDIQQRKGLYPPPPGASPVLGLEVAGEVVALGPEASGFHPGDKITALCNGGGYAEYVAVQAGQCLPWPNGFSAVQAAALPETYFTVWANVFDLGHLKAGERLLVHGGTSGIGTTAIQLAIARGAQVFATAGSAEKCASIEKLGALAIDYKTSDFKAEIATHTGGKGVDVVLDMVGAPYTAANLACLARGGRLVQIAFMQGSKVEKLDLLPVMMKRLTITGSTMRPRTAAEKATIALALQKNVWPLLESGTVAPLIDATFALEDVAMAHALMERSTHIGKIMLQIAG